MWRDGAAADGEDTTSEHERLSDGVYTGDATNSSRSILAGENVTAGQMSLGIEPYIAPAFACCGSRDADARPVANLPQNGSAGQSAPAAGTRSSQGLPLSLGLKMPAR